MTGVVPNDRKKFLWLFPEGAVSKFFSNDELWPKNEKIEKFLALDFLGLLDFFSIFSIFLDFGRFWGSTVAGWLPVGMIHDLNGFWD